MKIIRKEVITNISKVIIELESLRDILSNDIKHLTDVPTNDKSIIKIVKKQANRLITLKYLLKYNFKH